ncbi:MAG: histidinol-phosphate transaminase [FCB group bacterium]|nr:histidinol-phosphate transaminase [FCB group bacterium]
MKISIKDLVRPNILKMEKYASARDEFSGKADIFLDANENTIGSPSGRRLNRYPDPLQKNLRRAIADLKHISIPEKIFLGNGSDEAIDLILRVFCEPRKDSMMILSPTYGMYKVCAEINDIRVLDVPLRPDFSADTSAVIKTTEMERPKIIFVCSPNNPTANIIPAADIEKILLNTESMVVVDEAYIDFSDTPSWTERIDAFPNLIVLQTFSKAWGMAGVRMGMAFSNREVIALMNKIKYPYNINDVTAEIVLDALRHSEEKEQMVNRIRQQRDELVRLMREIPIVREVFPSQANFFLARFEDVDAIYRYLAGKGIIVRNRSRQIHCGGCLRITVGTPAENDKLLKALFQYQNEEK